MQQATCTPSVNGQQQRGPIAALVAAQENLIRQYGDIVLALDSLPSQKLKDAQEEVRQAALRCRQRFADSLATVGGILGETRRQIDSAAKSISDDVMASFPADGSEDEEETPPLGVPTANQPAQPQQAATRSSDQSEKNVSALATNIVAARQQLNGAGVARIAGDPDEALPFDPDPPAPATEPEQPSETDPVNVAGDAPAAAQRGCRDQWHREVTVERDTPPPQPMTRPPRGKRKPKPR